MSPPADLGRLSSVAHSSARMDLTVGAPAASMAVSVPAPAVHVISPTGIESAEAFGGRSAGLPRPANRQHAAHLARGALEGVRRPGYAWFCASRASAIGAIGDIVGDKAGGFIGLGVGSAWATW